MQVVTCNQPPLQAPAPSTSGHGGVQQTAPPRPPMRGSGGPGPQRGGVGRGGGGGPSRGGGGSRPPGTAPFQARRWSQSFSLTSRAGPSSSGSVLCVLVRWGGGAGFQGRAAALPRGAAGEAGTEAGTPTTGQGMASSTMMQYRAPALHQPWLYSLRSHYAASLLTLFRYWM